MTTASSRDAIQDLTEAPVRGGHAAFAEGPAGAGQREVLVRRVRHLLEAGVDGRQILVLVPDRALARPARAALHAATEDSDAAAAAGAVSFLTFYSVAKRAVELFWPVVAPAMGFAKIGAEPAFLTYETAQHVMGQVAEPLLAEGFFGDLTLPRPRLYGQLLSSHNAAAASGFPADDISARLVAAWTGEAAREHAYAQVQTCIDAYRAHCFAHGLVDVALLMESFTQVLLENEPFWSFLDRQYRHVLALRLEENVPAAHDFLRRWLPRCDSALLLYERDGGVRPFLHVSPESAYALKDTCQQTAVLKARDALAALEAFAAAVCAHLDGSSHAPGEEAAAAVRGVIEAPHRAEMLRAVAARVQALVEDGTAPSDIALIAPAVDGVLQFALSEALEAAGVPLRVLRPRESLRDEPLVRAVLTLAELAHPHWQQPPVPYDVTELLAQVVSDLDPVRAALWVRAGYDAATGRLWPDSAQPEDAAERVGTEALAAIDRLRAWIEAYAAEADETPLDHFVRRFFGDVYAGPDVPPAEAAVFSELTRSIGHFRRYAEAETDRYAHPGAAYVRMVRSGVLAAQYPVRQPAGTPPAAVTLAPAVTYVLSGRPAKVQFWLDLGAARWGRSPQQALTNPHVLSRRWSDSEKWTEPRDFTARTDLLKRLVRGLCRRCTGGLFLCHSDRQTGGEQQDGPLLRAVYAALEGREKGKGG